MVFRCESRRRVLKVAIAYQDPRLAGLGQGSATTDADGRFEIGGLCPERLEVSADFEVTVARVETTIETGRFAEITLYMH